MSKEVKRWDELKALAEGMGGWPNKNAFECDDAWCVGAIDEDENLWPVIEIQTEQYDAFDASEPMAKYYAAANPPAILELIAENERNQRMLLAACMDMGAIGEALGADMNSDGEELLSMVADMKTERDALLAERDVLKAENKRLHLMVAQADHNYDMDRDRIMYLLRTAHDCLEQWNLKYPRLAKRGEEFSSEHTYRQIRAFVPEYREADAALQGEQP